MVALGGRTATWRRPSILLNLTAFLGFGIFCLVMQAQLIQQDVLKRCRDALLAHRIRIDGLSVDGRDVVLYGPEGAAITSPQTHKVIATVRGVRSVRVVISEGQPTRNDGELEPAGSAGQRAVQDKIDQLLSSEPIAFVRNSTTLTPTSQILVTKLSAYLAEAPDLRCEIRVYDNYPRESRQYRVLALLRAQAIEDYLASKGIARSRLSTQALQPNEAAEARPKDRLVDLIVRAR